MAMPHGSEPKQLFWLCSKGVSSICQKELFVAESPKHAYAWQSTIAGRGHINIAVANIHRPSLAHAQLPQGLLNRVWRRLTAYALTLANGHFNQIAKEMAAKFSRFSDRVNELLAKQGGKSLNRWMDNQEVCQQLNISPRTLQTLRDNGTLAYSQINHKVFYRPEDVLRIVKPVEGKLADKAV